MENIGKGKEKENSEEDSSIGKNIDRIQVKSLMKILRQPDYKAKPRKKSSSSPRPGTKPRKTSKGLVAAKIPSVAATDINCQDIRKFLNVTPNLTDNFISRGKVVETVGRLSDSLPNITHTGPKLIPEQLPDNYPYVSELNQCRKGRSNLLGDEAIY